MAHNLNPTGRTILNSPMWCSCFYYSSLFVKADNLLKIGPHLVATKAKSIHPLLTAIELTLEYTNDNKVIKYQFRIYFI